MWQIDDESIWNSDILRDPFALGDLQRGFDENRQIITLSRHRVYQFVATVSYLTPNIRSVAVRRIS